MDTKCASLLANFFLYGYEAGFIKGLLKAGKKNVAQKFNFTHRYIDHVLSLNTSMISDFFDLIYPCELDIKNTTESNTSALYLDCYLCTDHGKLVTFFFDKRDNFNFSIVNFPFLCSNIPSAPAYGVYVSQLVRYAIACCKFQDYVDRGKLPHQ